MTSNSSDRNLIRFAFYSILNNATMTDTFNYFSRLNMSFTPNDSYKDQRRRQPPPPVARPSSRNHSILSPLRSRQREFSQHSSGGEDDVVSDPSTELSLHPNDRQKSGRHCEASSLAFRPSELGSSLENSRLETPPRVRLMCNGYSLLKKNLLLSTVSTITWKLQSSP